MLLEIRNGKGSWKGAATIFRASLNSEKVRARKDTVSSNTDGLNLGYRYDELNRLEHVDDGSGTASGAVVHTTDYTYNPNGSLETVTAPNGVQHSYQYDTLNRLRSLSVSDLSSHVLRSYTYSLRGAESAEKGVTS